MALLGRVARGALRASPSARATRSSAGNSAGNNAFFVRRDVLGDLPELSVERGLRAEPFRESRGPEQELTYVGRPRERLRAHGRHARCGTSTRSARSRSRERFGL